MLKCKKKDDHILCGYIYARKFSIKKSRFFCCRYTALKMLTKETLMRWEMLSF